MESSISINDSKISYRDVYLRLWSNRDLEIAHVWQRAIFLTAFLIACFAGYGGAIVSIFASGQKTIPLPVANGLAFAIAVVGMIISLLWIMMAKGSKMWYENYEKAIDAFSKLSDNNGAFDNNVNEIASIHLSRMDAFESPKLSDWIWSTRGGRFSVSRINIFIGQLALIIWSVILTGHIIVAKMSFKNVAGHSLIKTFINWQGMMLFLVVVLLLFWLFAHFMLKSKEEA